LSLARSENNLALLLVKRGELDAAGHHLNRALALFDEAAVESGRAEILLSLCELDIARSRLDAAETYAVEARTYAERLNEQATLADSHQSLGRIAAERGDHDRVDAEFREAWGILDALGSEERLSRCHVVYAELLEKRGDLAAANRQLRLALNRLHPAKIAPPAQLERSATA
jgi:tetratricopeptide (TPR) repeat protein